MSYFAKFFLRFGAYERLILIYFHTTFICERICERHRTKDRDSKRFWDKIEDELLHEKRTEEKNRDMDILIMLLRYFFFPARGGVMERIE